MSRTGQVSTTCKRIADFGARIDVHWESSNKGVERAFAAYDSAEGNDSDVEIEVFPSSRFLPPPTHSPEPVFYSTYGRFLKARWQLTRPVGVQVAPRRTPLRLARPFVNYDGNGIPDDVGRILNERVISTFVQLTCADRMSFVHGAAMADGQGNGLLISGRGGVGKTSLALELGLNHNWSFISDDLVILDKAGLLHLNANPPKLYAYNVLGDAALEGHLMAGRGLYDRLQWRLRRPWPDRVRREMDPVALYGSTVAQAPLVWMLIVDRDDVDQIEISSMGASEAAAISVDILFMELARVAPDVERFLASPGAECFSTMKLTWDSATWTSTLVDGLRRSEILRIRVPRAMRALDYRREMAAVVAAVTASFGKS